MKKILSSIVLIAFVSLLFGCTSSQNGYRVTPISKADQGNFSDAIVYALPKTVLKIEVVIQKQEKVKGPYAEFASKLLGINNFISNNQTTYSIYDANISTFSEVDSEQYYFVYPKSSNIRVQVSATGIIQSINEPSLASENKMKRHRNIELNSNGDNDIQKEPKNISLKSNLLKDFIVDFPREDMPSKTPVNELSLRKQAEEAADYINKIRQKKLELLSGEYDDQYSSHAIEFMYTKLDSIENYYLTFFTGCIHTSTFKETFTFTPEKSELTGPEITSTLFKMSETEGILSPSSDSGVPFQINIKCKNSLLLLNNYNKTAKNSSAKVSESFYYRIPEETIVSIQSGLLQKSETILVAQFGTVMNLPKTALRAKFNAETGSVIEYKAIQ